MKKLFIIKKYVIAESAEDAIKKERRVRPDDVWVDEDFRKNSKIDLPGSIRYNVEHEYYSSDEWAKVDKINKKLTKN
jgi:hypothetical protein